MLKKKAILINLIIPVYQKLKEIANKKGISFSELLRRIIEDYLEQFGD